MSWPTILAFDLGRYLIAAGLAATLLHFLVPARGAFGAIVYGPEATAWPAPFESRRRRRKPRRKSPDKELVPVGASGEGDGTRTRNIRIDSPVL